MSEKLSELKQVYTCDLCGVTECVTPTKKTFAREGKNNEGDLIVYDYIAYFCCRDNNSSSYCEYCEKISTPEVKVDVPSIKDEVVKESTVIKKVIDESKIVVKVDNKLLQERKEALLKQLEELHKQGLKPEE